MAEAQTAQGGAATSDDLAPRTYWDGVWDSEVPPEAIDPDDQRPGNHLNRRFDELFRCMLDGVPRGARLLEIGCARSQWLPYFARRFGFEVHGIDYSERGCEQARNLMRAAAVDGRVLVADVFSPPSELLDRFDVVVSFGLVEHFRDTADIVERLAALAAPGGLVITVIPNMHGLPGLMTRALNPDVYAMHVPLDPSALAAAHQSAGLAVKQACWFGTSNFAVVNLQGVDGDHPATRMKHVIRNGLVRVSQAFWAAELAGVRLRNTRRWAPYVVCQAQKPRG